MAAEVAAAPAPPATEGSQGGFDKEELDRMLEFDRIVKFRDTITSGKHPRIRVPPQLLSTASTSHPPAPRPNGPGVHDASPTPAAPTDTPDKRQPAKNGQSVAGMAVFPGLGYVPKGPAAMMKKPSAGRGREVAGAKGVSSGGAVLTEFEQKRAQLEQALQEQGEAASSKDVLSKEAPPHVDIDSVLQRAYILEKSFTPPPQAPESRVTNAKGKEFGLTSRVPVESDNDDVSMEDSSDYEPELDTVPPPIAQAQTLPAGSNGQQQQQQQQQLQQLQHLMQPPPPQQSDASAYFNLSAAVSSLLSRTGTSQATAPGLQHSWRAGQARQPAGEFPSAESGQTSSGAASLPQAVGRQPEPPSPYVRAGHNLSPVAPQPTHAAALAAATEQLASAVQGGSIGVGHLGTPPQVAVLRRERALLSSPDSSPQTSGSQPTEQRRGKKKNKKRKAEQAAVVPEIKPEPRSPSPIAAPPLLRPSKRQRPAPRAAHNGRPYGGPGDHGHGHDHGRNTGVREGYAAAPAAFRDERGPVLVERAAPERYVSTGGGGGYPMAMPPAHESWEGYETRPGPGPGYAPPAYAQPARSSSTALTATHYAVPPSRADMRPVRAASHALVEVSPGYVRAPVGYAEGYENGRMSVQPERYLEAEAGPVEVPRRTSAMGLAMGPPATWMAYPAPAGHETPYSPPAATTRIVVDEYGREYYEPLVRPAVRQAVLEMAPRGRYEADMVYERAPAGGYRAASAMPAGPYEDEQVVYQRPASVYGPGPGPGPGPGRRMVAQPEYVAYEAAGERGREYAGAMRAPTAVPAPAPGDAGVAYEAGPPPAYGGGQWVEDVHGSVPAPYYEYVEQPGHGGVPYMGPGGGYGYPGA